LARVRQAGVFGREASTGGRRTRIDLMAIILHAAVGGAGKTALMHTACLDTRGINRTLSILVATGLLQREVGDGGRAKYRTTGKGLLFLRYYRGLHRLIHEKTAPP
jgi:predicted transcriptional regulator